MATMKTPGVYIVEKNAFPNSVVEVATAVPAFIGYTEKADNGGKSLVNQPWRISSMAEFHRYFGFAPAPRFMIAEKGSTPPKAFTPGGGKEYVVAQTAGRYLLYYSMLLFFQNGGGPCYVVSVGRHGDDGGKIDAAKLTAGIEPLVKEQEPTMVVVPDAVLLSEPDCISLQQAVLLHCGGVMRNRVAILDVYDGYMDLKDGVVANFRNDLGINFLNYAAAYYPWVHTTIVQDRDLDYTVLEPESAKTLQGMLKADLGLPDTDDKAEGKVKAQLDAVSSITLDDAAWKAKVTKDVEDKLAAKAIDDAKAARLKEPAAVESAVRANRTLLNQTLVALSAGSPSNVFNTVMADIKHDLNLLPPAAAMAGVYTMVDNSRGVWKAPANVSLNSVVAPAVNISSEEQEDLNVTTQGKSINAIRSFIGEGTLVWGARTLDGNSLDWRYINVRRTLIMLEESIKLAAKAMVFEPNVANTWVTIKSMIRNFLTGIWKRGGLAGAVPDDAFSVHVGLGETMTPEDILEGILRVTVLVAVSRPAEFIEITFQQQMQKS